MGLFNLPCLKANLDNSS